MSFIMGNKIFKFSHESFSVLEIIYEKLKRKAYLTSFSSYFKLSEMIGSGNFGKVKEKIIALSYVLRFIKVLIKMIQIEVFML